MIWTEAGSLGAGVGVFLFWAVAAMLAIRRFAADLRVVENRISAPALWIGGGTNLLVLLSTLILVQFLLRQPISALRLHLTLSDLWFSLLLLIVGFVSAALFVQWLRRGAVRVMALPRSRLVLAGMLVLGIVATQEEFLFRGYTRIVLERTPVWSYLLVSTAIFVVVHFLTNKITVPQVIGWTLGGGLLGFVFLASGSIWTAVILHFAIDADNVLVFDVTGQGGFFKVPRPITESERLSYRLAFTGLVVVLTYAWYGTTRLG